MIKTAVSIMVMLFFLSGQAHAQEVGLPEELRRTEPKIAALAEGDLLEGAVSVIQDGLKEAEVYLLSGIRSVATIMAGMVLLSVADCVTGEGRTGNVVTVVGTLWITAVSAGDVEQLIGLGQETVQRISGLSKLLLPAMAAADAATGGINASSVRQVGTVFFSDILLTIQERLLLPALYIYIGIAAAGTILDGDALESIAALIKKAVTWVLGGLLALFTTYLSISGAVAGAADAQTVRIAKAAVSTAVPLVGGILAEAAETVVAGAGILRGMIGAFGTLAVLGMCLVPFLRLGGQYILYRMAGLATASVGPKKLTKLLSLLADAFAIVLAMTASSALLLIISLMSALTAVAP